MTLKRGDTVRCTKSFGGVWLAGDLNLLPGSFIHPGDVGVVARVDSFTCAVLMIRQGSVVLITHTMLKQWEKINDCS
jgi:hypothetical protein